jgi:AraC-like DNA-binding protein
VTSDEGTLVLAGETGGYQEFRAPAALGQHFQCIWSNTLAREAGGRMAIVPDGCVDLTWIDGNLVVAGPDVGVAISRIAPGSTIIGVRFRPGAAAEWLGLPMSEIVGARPALAEFWGPAAREIAARMGEAHSQAERMRAFQEALCRRIPHIDPPNPEIGLVFSVLKTEPAGTGVALVLDRLDTSPRTLRRRCHEAFGYGPKTLDRILRFQRFLKRARQADEPQLAALAFDAGYADQAHLTREVRSLSGFSPAMILSQLRA